MWLYFGITGNAFVQDISRRSNFVEKLSSLGPVKIIHKKDDSNVRRRAYWLVVEILGDTFSLFNLHRN